MKDTTPNLSSSQKRNILVAMCTALIAVIASVSALNVAQPGIADSLGASAGDVVWVINIYTLVLAALLMPIGAIGDRWGRRPVLLAGLVVFGVATLGAALAPSVGVMIAARALAGLGAAMVMPVTLSVITTSFPADERPRAIGIWAGFSGAGAIIGLWASAIMVDLVSWRWLYALPFVLIVFSAAVSYFVVPNSRERSGRFDLPGSILSAFAIGGLVFGIHEGPSRGWGAPLALVPLLMGVGAMALFIWWELRTEHPLIDLRAFANRDLASGTVALTLQAAVLFGVFLVLFPFYQTVLGWSAIRSAFAMMPLALCMMPMAGVVAPRLIQRVGRRIAMLIGIIFALAGLSILAMAASVDASYWSILPGLVILGSGIGLMITPSTEAITASMPPEKQGVASALNDTSREFGSAIGIALLGSILTAGYGANVAGFVATQAEPIAQLVGEDYFVALRAAQTVATEDPGLAARILDAAQQAYVDSWITTIWVGVGVLAVAFACIVILGLRRRRSGAPGAETHNEQLAACADPD